MLLYESDQYGFFNRIVFSEHAMDNPLDMKIEKNFYICPKEEYYCDEIYGTEIPRKKLRKKTHKKDPIIKSSSNKFPFAFNQNDRQHLVGQNRESEDLCNDEEVKKLPVMDKLLMFLLRPCFRNQILIAHNSSRFGEYFLLLIV